MNVPVYGFSPPCSLGLFAAPGCGKQCYTEFWELWGGGESLGKSSSMMLGSGIPAGSSYHEDGPRCMLVADGNLVGAQERRGRD